MSLVVTVAGVVKTLQMGWTIQSVVNGRDTLTAAIASTTATYRPAVDDEILLVESFGTSASSVAIGTGAKVFTTQAGLAIVTGERVRVYRTSSVLNWMEGTVTSYSGTTLTLNVETVNGSGTYSDWTIGRRIFGGEIQTAHEHGAGGFGIVPIVTEISAIDFNALVDRRYVTTTIAAGTLKQALQALDDYLTPYGVTLDPDQVNGPSLDELRYDSTPLADVFANLETVTGYVRDISYYKVLRMWLPGGGGEAAPFNLAADDGHTIGDVEVDTSRSAAGRQYANRVFLKFSAAATRAYAYLGTTGNFSNGETVTVGSQTYTFTDPFVDASGNLALGASADESLAIVVAAIVAGGNGVNVGTGTPVNSAASAYLHSSGLVKAFANTAGAAGNSIACTETCANAAWGTEGGGAVDTFRLGLDQALTNTVQADDPGEQAAHGLWEIVIQAPEVFDYTAAQTLADAYLTQHTARPQTVIYTTRDTGLRCGQTQTILLAARDIDASFLLTEINAWVEETVLKRTVTAVEGTAFLGNWRQVYQQWGGASTVPTVLGGVGSTTIVGRSIYFLGGSAIEYVDAGAPAWVPVDGTVSDPGTQVVIDTAVRGSTTGTVVARLRASSGTVQARLRNVTNGTTAGTSAAVNSTTFETVSFPVTLTAGSRTYQLELLGSVASADLAGIGYLE